MERGRKVAITLLKAVLAVVIVTLAVHGLLVYSYGRRYESDLQKLRAEGQPLTIAEMAGPPVAASENGAVELKNVFAMIDAKSKPSMSSTHTNEEAEERVREWASKRAADPDMDRVLLLTEQALAKPKMQFVTDWSNPFSTPLPHYAKMRELARVLSARTLADAQRGRTDQALREIRLIYRLGSAAGEDPTLISCLVRVAIDNLASGTLGDIARTGRFSEAQARDLNSFLSEWSIRPQFVRALRGERAFGIWMFEQARSRGPIWAMKSLGWGEEQPGAGMLNSLAAGVWKPFNYVDGSAYLKLMAREIKLGSKPYRSIPKADREEPVRGAPAYALVTRGLVPALNRVNLGMDKSLAQVGLARLSLALEVFKKKTGAYPASIAELRGQLGWPLPQDPFTGKDFIYKRQGKGYVISSAGARVFDNHWSFGSIQGGSSKAPKTDKSLIWTANE